MYNYKTNSHIKEEVFTKMYTWIINLKVYRFDNVQQNMYSEVSVTQSVVFVNPFWPLHCLSLFGLPLLINTLEYLFLYSKFLPL